MNIKLEPSARRPSWIAIKFEDLKLWLWETENVIKLAFLMSIIGVSFLLGAAIVQNISHTMLYLQMETL